MRFRRIFLFTSATILFCSFTSTLCSFRPVHHLLKDCLSAYNAAFAQAPDDSLYNEKGVHLRRVYQDNFVSISSTVRMDKDAAAKLATDLHAAYDFDTQENSWTLMTKLLEPVMVRVRPDLPGGRLGIAVFPNIVAFNSEFISTPIMQGVMAQELSHLQDERQLAGHQIPAWFLQGRAWLNGRNFRTKLGLPVTDRDRDSTKFLAKLKAKDALEIIDNESAQEPTTRDQLEKVELTGSLFIEFLRTKYGGGGFPDAKARGSRLIEIVAQQQPFQLSFDRAFGAPIADSKLKFGRFLNYTEGHPEVRFVGTAFEKIAK